MSISSVTAHATTFRIEPGSETAEDGCVHIRGRVFTDRVESASSDLDGTNRVVVNLDIAADGSGRLTGEFELSLSDDRGSWQGELDGHLENGMVVSRGLAHGTGALQNGIVYIEFRQIPEHPGTPPVEQPLAFFQMKAVARLTG